MRVSHFSRFALLVLLAASPGLASAAAQDSGDSDAQAAEAPPPPIPPRSASGLGLEVPDAELDEGLAYHVMPGDTQITLTSKGPMQRMVLASGAAVGFAVAPFDPEEEGALPLLAGALRVPVRSFTTGSPEIDAALAGEAFLNAEAHPEIAFLFDTLRDVERLESDDEEVQRFRGEISGRLVALGKTVPVRTSAEVTLMLSSFKTLRRYVGDLLRVETRFEVRPADFGYQAPGGGFGGPIPAETLEIDVFLVMTTVLPENNLDPTVKHDVWLAEQRYIVLARDLGDAAAAAEHGRAHLERVAGDAVALRSFAALILDTPGLDPRDLGLALAAAEKANAAAGEGDGAAIEILERIRAAGGLRSTDSP